LQTTYTLASVHIHIMRQTAGACRLKYLKATLLSITIQAWITWRNLPMRKSPTQRSKETHSKIKTHCFPLQCVFIFYASDRIYLQRTHIHQIRPLFICYQNFLLRFHQMNFHIISQFPRNIHLLPRMICELNEINRLFFLLQISK